MKPDDLTAASFSVYPTQARALARQYLDILQKLPLPFAAIMLHEVSAYDWNFPAERRALEGQLMWLQTLSSGDRDQVLRGFAQLSLSSSIKSQHWVTHPQQFSETMTAYLWSTQQMDAFQAAATGYVNAWRRAIPEAAPVMPRLCIVILGEGVKADGYPLFLKLRPHGVFFPQVDPTGGMQAIFETVSGRVTKLPSHYEHWYIDGGKAEPWSEARVTCISWAELDALRTAVLRRMHKIIASSGSGPEKLRTILATTTPAELGMASNKDEVLNRFAISIFTEGSGTQIFSTTFAQWTAREAFRRAQPSTLVVRFAPRQRELPMNELLTGLTNHNIPDQEGSLIDADMGSAYTWINQQRLTGADGASFIAWSQEQNQAMAIGPGFPQSTVALNRVTVKQLLEQ